MLPVLLASALSLAASDGAQGSPPDTDRPAWTVTVDPLTYAIGYAHLQVERRLSDGFSLYAGPHARLYDGILTEEPEPFIGLGAEVGLRWFPWGAAPEGPWVMVRSVGARLSTTDGPKQAAFGGYSSVLLGGTVLVADVLVLSGGAGYNQLYYAIGDYGPSGPFVALHTNLGVAF
jgi:hypothetical protein